MRVRWALPLVVILASLASTTPATAKFDAPVAPSLSAVPRSAHGCDLYTCITVTGTGLFVSSVQTTAPVCNGTVYYKLWPHVKYYTFQWFYVDAGSPWPGYVTGPPNGCATVSWTWYPRSYFPDQTRICAYWTGGINGTPCETVHR